MTKKTELKVCDMMLAAVTALTALSSIQLEVTGSRDVTSVWIHAGVSSLFFVNIVWHLKLHFGWKGWVGKLRRQRSQATRLMSLASVLTLASACVALVHWSESFMHSKPGAIHGKIGILFLILAVGHTLKRIAFFKSKPKRAQQA